MGDSIQTQCRFLGADDWYLVLTYSSIKTPVVFIPCTTPLPPSKLRQKAYQEAVPPPLPNDDPSGWHSLPQVRVKGTIPTDDSKMPIEVIYSVRRLLLAKL